MIRTLCKIYQIKTPKCSQKFPNTIKLTLSFLYINKQNMLLSQFGTTKTLWLYMSLLYSLNISFWRVEKIFHPFSDRLLSGLSNFPFLVYSMVLEGETFIHCQILQRACKWTYLSSFKSPFYPALSASSLPNSPSQVVTLLCSCSKVNLNKE